MERDINYEESPRNFIACSWISCRRTGYVLINSGAGASYCQGSLVGMCWVIP